MRVRACAPFMYSPSQGALLLHPTCVGELLQLWSGALHPHQAQLCATAGGNSIQLWDLRSMRAEAEQVGSSRGANLKAHL